MEKETKTSQDNIEEEVPLSLKPKEGKVIKEEKLAR
jgi:hypothetical protein